MIFKGTRMLELKSKFLQNKLITGIFFLAVCFLVMLPASPAIQPVPHRDSGVFLYIGNAILDGGIPYRDVWDHKGPLVYYINALGLLINDGSLWGGWVVELIFLCISILVIFAFLRDKFGYGYAFCGGILWILLLSRVLDGGNRVEEYALLFYALQIFLVFKEGSERSVRMFFLLAGVFAGLGMLLRPNLISPILTVYLLFFLGFRVAGKKAVTFDLPRIAFLTAGLFFIVAGALSYFSLHYALFDLYRDVWVYNFSYSTQGGQYWSSVVKAFHLFGPMLPISFVAWLVMIWSLKSKQLDATDFELARYFVFFLPIEAVLSMLSGYGYVHYYISWVPFLVASFCIFMHILSRLLERRYNFNFWKFPGTFFLAVIFLQAWLFWGDMRIHLEVVEEKMEQSGDFLLDYGKSPEWGDLAEIYEFVPHDSQVLFWGNEVQYNFVLGFPAPGRYIYLYPFMSPEYAGDGMIDELLETIQMKKTVIVDVRPSLVPPVQSLSGWKQYSGMLRVARYINDNYQVVGEFQVDNYYIVLGEKWLVNQKMVIWVHR